MAVGLLHKNGTMTIKDTFYIDQFSLIVFFFCHCVVSIFAINVMYFRNRNQSRSYANATNV